MSRRCILRQSLTSVFLIQTVKYDVCRIMTAFSVCYGVSRCVTFLENCKVLQEIEMQSGSHFIGQI